MLDPRALGRSLYATALFGFGALHLTHAAGMAPIAGPPWKLGGALASALVGVLLVGVGVSLAAQLRGRVSALVAALLCLGFAALYLPALVERPRHPAAWTSAAELLSLAGAALALADLPRARILFALPLTVIGVQHFLYAEFLATLVPSWIPAPLFWAYLVGVALIAGALSLSTTILARLAAPALALMFAGFVALLHVPRVLAALDQGNEWTSLLVALAMCGASLVVMPRRR